MLLGFVSLPIIKICYKLYIKKSINFYFFRQIVIYIFQ